jgi:hypothetical protein
LWAQRQYFEAKQYCQKKYVFSYKEVTIVIYYRPLYSLIASVYNEVTKKRKLADTDSWEKSIVEFIIKKRMLLTPLQFSRR